jgi:glutathione S-transferase
VLEATELVNGSKTPDMFAGAHKHADMIAKNPMGKLAIIVAGGTAVAQAASIGFDLADKYQLGPMAPFACMCQ